MKRREFVTASSLAATSLLSAGDLFAHSRTRKTHNERVRGLLLGGLIGDALGGPIEFRNIPPSESKLTGARDWDAHEQLTKDRLRELAASVPLHAYEQFRPEPAAYGPWISQAPAGTLTDDSRHKIVLMRALANAQKLGREPTARDIAEQFIAFEPLNQQADPSLESMNEEGFREYRYAARWLLGERDLTQARPLERLWAGVGNCSGQMMFPPLAGRFAGDPQAAYRATYEMDFIDTPFARDVTSALVAGLAAALGADLDRAPARRRWEALLAAMRRTDPFGYAEVPFAGRQLDRWLAKAEELSDTSEGSPQRLYHLLETDGQPVYWWDAHFTLLVPLSMLHLCDFDGMAAMHLTLDFGHDTDSYAQVLGCMIGAVHGSSAFAKPMIEAVQTRLMADFGESIDEWLQILCS